MSSLNMKVMSSAELGDAFRLLGAFLPADTQYRDSSSVYGGVDPEALQRGRARRFYRRLGFRALNEERLALLL